MTKRLVSPVEWRQSVGKRGKMTINLHFHAVKTILSAKTPLKTVGVVAWGAEFGLLAVDDRNTYFRVNGTLIERLDQEEVHRQLAKLLTWVDIRKDKSWRQLSGPKVEPSVERKKSRRIAASMLLTERDMDPATANLDAFRAANLAHLVQQKSTLRLGCKTATLKTSD